MDNTKLSIEESAHEHEMEIQDQDGRRLGTVWLESPDTATGEEMAFGIELVRRWNTHNALIDALEWLLKAARKANSHAQCSLGYADNEAHFVGEWIDAAKATLNAAKAQ